MTQFYLNYRYQPTIQFNASITTKTEANNFTKTINTILSIARYQITRSQNI